MMNFRVIKNAIIQTLWNNQGSDFRTIGYQKQTKSAKEFKNDNKLVEVLFSEGEFPRSGSSNQVESKHNLQYNIEFTVSAAATGDIQKATDSTASALERSAAIASIKEATEKVDIQIDEFIDRVYQIIMNAANRFFGLNKGVLSGRMITRIKKDDSVADGSLVVKTALMDLTCSTIETVSGLIDPNAGDEKIIDTDVGMVGDDIAATGLEITTPEA